MNNSNLYIKDIIKYYEDFDIIENYVYDLDIKHDFKISNSEKILFFAESFLNTFGIIYSHEGNFYKSFINIDNININTKATDFIYSQVIDSFLFNRIEINACYKNKVFINLINMQNEICKSILNNEKIRLKLLLGNLINVNDLIKIKEI